MQQVRSQIETCPFTGGRLYLILLILAAGLLVVSGCARDKKAITGVTGENGEQEPPPNYAPTNLWDGSSAYYKCRVPCEEGLTIDDENGDPIYLDCADGLLSYCTETTETSSTASTDTTSEDQIDCFCPDDAQCVSGTCLRPGGILPSCNHDLECPYFQACIGGECHSNCENDEECDDGLSCHNFVCRQPCELAEKNACGSGYVCEPVDDYTGYCSMVGQAEEETRHIIGAFTLEKTEIGLNSVYSERNVLLTNDTDTDLVFKIQTTARLGFEVYETEVDAVDNKAVRTITDKILDSDVDDPLEVRVPARSEVNIRIINENPDLETSWNGVVLISNKYIGSKQIRVSFKSRPEGEWVGKVYYFANFEDFNIDEWKEDDFSVGTGGSIGNGFMRHWAKFRAGRKTYDDFMAMFSATLSGSWNWPSVTSLCAEEFSNVDACYLIDNERGIERFATSLNSAPIPSGGLELPITLNMRRVYDNTADVPDETIYYGRIVSRDSMHYAGNPHLNLVFAEDPNDCLNSVNPALCLHHIESLDFSVYVGGRYAPDETDTDCRYGDNFSFAKSTFPWLVPGFTFGTELDGESYYKSECRDKWLPAGNNAAEYEMNASFAGSNPIPDGRTRKRSVELVDGIILNQDTMIIVFKETFESFLGSAGMGTDGGGSFEAFGIMYLTLTPRELTLAEFDGASLDDDRTQPDDLLAYTCSDEILDDIFPGQGTEEIDYNELAEIVIIGNNQSGVQLENLIEVIDYEKVHYLCEYPSTYYQDYMTDPEFGTDTEPLHRDHFDSGRESVYDATTQRFVDVPRTFCPPGSLVTYFTLDDVDDETLSNHPCQPAEGVAQEQSCRDALDKWLSGAGPYTVIQEQAIWRCEDPNEVQCDMDRFDLRDAKLFYSADQEDESKVVYQSLYNEIDQAFRYKTQFVSRSGATIGFAPEECVPNAGSIPYCYDPEAIEKIQQRINCALQMYTDEDYADVIGGVGGSKQIVKSYLETNFADGFEYLNAELLIMLGDEAYTDAFASRFDLAGSNNLAFEGSLFEPDGINLSGGAGFEMYKLYQAAQYYQMVLDRFYNLSPAIWKSISGNSASNFITQESITMYVNRLVRASAQKARAWSEVAVRYQNFNQPDLARMVVQRAYTATYLELIILRKMMDRIKSILPLADQAQVEILTTQTIRLYKAAMLEMRNIYSEITDGINYFGFSPDYIPLPALDDSDNNAFEKILASARRKIDVAREDEYKALDDTRAYDVDAAEFQAELVSIQNTYENQLGELCGSFKYPEPPEYIPGAQIMTTAEDEQDFDIFPAIPKYAHLNDTLKLYHNPCGLVANGMIYEAVTRVEVETAELRRILQQMNNVESEIEIEQEYATLMCEKIGDEAEAYCTEKLSDANDAFGWCLANVGLVTASHIAANALTSGIFVANRVKEGAQDVVDAAGRALDMSKCTVIAGTAAGTDCPTAAIATATFTGTVAAAQATIQGAQITIEMLEMAKSELEFQTTRVQMVAECFDASGSVQLECDLRTQENEFKCDYVEITSNAKIKTLALSLNELSIDALKAQYRIGIALSEVERLRNKASGLIAEQEEAEEMSINIEAARNNPNIRIYKNDAIITADRTFYSALAEVYKATKVFEYYTSSSYEPMFILFLVRMVTAGNYTLESYLDELEDAYWEFNEDNGNPDLRVEVLSLKDDILKIPRVDTDGSPLSEMERIQKFRNNLTNVANLDGNGYLSIPFRTSLDRLSPLTRNHKIEYVEAEIVGSEIGDEVGRLYLQQNGTGFVLGLDGEKDFYAFPDRTAVINTFFNGNRSQVFNSSELYQNQRLKNRPLLNTGWSLIFNQVDEYVNQDVNISSLSDIRLYIYYSDFTVF